MINDPAVPAPSHPTFGVSPRKPAGQAADIPTLPQPCAWTGARWGELAGLQRLNVHLDDATIVIDPDIGALHEVNGHFELVLQG